MTNSTTMTAPINSEARLPLPADFPSDLADSLTACLVWLHDYRESIARGRYLDRQFGGDGRYLGEMRDPNHKSLVSVAREIREFVRLAREVGENPHAILRTLEAIRNGHTPEAPAEVPPPISGGSPALDTFALAYSAPTDPIASLPWRLRPVARFLAKPTWTVKELSRVEALTGHPRMLSDDDVCLSDLLDFDGQVAEFKRMARKALEGFPMAPDSGNVHEFAPIRKSKPSRKPATPKAPSRSADSIILEAVEAYRDCLDRNHPSRPAAVAAVDVIYRSATGAQRSAITRKLNTMGFSDDYRDSNGRFLGFVGLATEGSPVSFPDPDQVEAPDFDDEPAATEAYQRDFVHLTFDVVQHVKPGTMASYPAGSWLDASFSTLRQAREYAARCNQFALVEGIRYEVVPTDAESPNRRQSIADWKRGQQAQQGDPGFSGEAPDTVPSLPESIPPVCGGCDDLAVMGPQTSVYPFGDFDPTGRSYRAEMRAIESTIRAEITDIIRIHREAFEARETDGGVTAIAELAWEALCRENDGFADDFAAWLDWIAYRPGFADYGRLAPDEAWTQFLIECLTGCEAWFPLPQPPTGDDSDSSTSYNTDGQGAVNPSPILNTTSRSGERHVDREHYHCGRVPSSPGIPPLQGRDRRVGLEPMGAGWQDIQNPELLEKDETERGQIRAVEGISQGQPESGAQREGLDVSRPLAGSHDVRGAQATGNGGLPQQRREGRQSPGQPQMGHPRGQHDGYGQARDQSARVEESTRQTDRVEGRGNSRIGEAGRRPEGHSQTVRSHPRNHIGHSRSETMETSGLTGAICYSPTPDPTDPNGDDDETEILHGQRPDHESAHHDGGAGDPGGSEPRHALHAAHQGGGRGDLALAQGLCGDGADPRPDHLTPPAREWSELLGRYVIDWARLDPDSPAGVFCQEVPDPAPRFSGDTLVIRGTTYGLERHDWGFTLEKPSGDLHEVTVRPDGSVRCSCPDHHWRSQDNPGHLCKHGKALIDAGLIPPVAQADAIPVGIRPMVTLDTLVLA